MATPRSSSIQEEPDTPFETILTIGVTHGQALWILSQLGFDSGMTRKSFNYYIKSLRRLGLPFPRGETGLNPRRLAIYSYNHLMELSIALNLRIYGMLPDLVLGGLMRFRDDLYRCYRTAYVERASGAGSSIIVVAKDIDMPGFGVGGIYLDLQLRYSAGQLESIGPPRCLGPFEVLAWFAHTELPDRVHPPMNLS